MARIFTIPEMTAALDKALPYWDGRKEDWRSEPLLEDRVNVALRQICRVCRHEGEAAALDYLEDCCAGLGVIPLIMIANLIWLARRLGQEKRAVTACLDFADAALADGFDDLGLEACSAALLLDTHGDYALTVSPERSRCLADRYEAVACRHQARFTTSARTCDQPLTVGLVVSNLVDHVVAYTKTVTHFARYYDRRRFRLRVYSSENLTQRDLRLFPFGGHGYRSERTGAATMQECRELGVPAWLAPRDCPPIDAAARLSAQMVADGVEVAVFQSGLACPIDWLTARLAPVPVKLAINIGSFLFNPGLDLTLYDNPADIAREAEWADSRMGRRLALCQGTDIRDLDNQNALPRARFGLPAEALVLGVMSNHLDRRLSDSFMTVIADVLQRNPQVWFMPVGNPCLPAKMAFFAERGVAERVVWPGQQQKAGAVLKMMDIYVNEFPVGGSQSVIEAMACGLPVAALRWSAAHAECAGAEIVGAQYAVPDQNVADYQALIQHWLDDPAARRAAGRMLRRRAAAHYAVDAYVQTVLNLGADMLAEALRSPAAVCTVSAG